MSGDDQQFCLRWNDFQTNMVASFKHLRDEKSFCDVTIATEGQHTKAKLYQLQFWSKNARSQEEQENLIKSVHAQSKIHEVFLKVPTTPKKKPKFKFDHNRNTNVSTSKGVKRKYSPVVEVVSSCPNESSNTVAVELNNAAENANEEDFEEPMPVLQPLPKRREVENPNDVPI